MYIYGGSKALATSSRCYANPMLRETGQAGLRDAHSESAGQKYGATFWQTERFIITVKLVC